MPTTLLPFSPQLAGSLSELAVPFIHAKALADPQPTSLEYGVDGIMLAAVSAENTLNMVTVVRNRMPVTAVVAGVLATTSANASLMHATRLMDEEPICHTCEPKEQRLKERVATVLFTAGQLFVNHRLNK